MKAPVYVLLLAALAAGTSVTFSPLGAAEPNLSNFCPDYSSNPKCQAAADLYLASSHSDAAIIALVTGIADKAKGKRPIGRSCADLVAGLDDLAAAVKDGGSKALIKSLAASLCDAPQTKAGDDRGVPYFATGSTGFKNAPPCSSSGSSGGNTSGGNTSGSSGESSSGSNTSGGNTSGGASSGTSGESSSGSSSGASGGASSSGASGGAC